MDVLAGTIKEALFVILVLLTRIGAFFSRTAVKLHSARFARVHELDSLSASVPSTQTSILLGTTHLNRILRVRPSAKRRELGNLLVVAPTRGGKGLLATAQLLTWRHSVVVNDIKGDLFLQTASFFTKAMSASRFLPSAQPSCSPKYF